MRQHVIRFGCLALVAAGAVLNAQQTARSGQVPVLPPIADPQADFAPGVPRGSTPGVVLPQAIKTVNPAYSKQARRDGIQGTVILDAVVGVDGKVEESRVRCSLDPGLDGQAMKALKGWTFKPAQLNGAPTRFVVAVEMEFRQYDNVGPTSAPSGTPRAAPCRPPDSR